MNRESQKPSSANENAPQASLILPGMHPDPTICRVGDRYYLATSSFGFFPGVPLYTSEDLIEWTFVRHILSRPEQLPLAPDQPVIGRGIFAPTLRHDGERFYLVTTNMRQGGNFIVSAKNAEDEWSDPVWIEEAYQGGIDPSITFLEDGRVLYQVTADEGRGDQQGITQFEIDLKTGKGLSPRQHLSSGCGWRAVEGPHLFKKGDFWYLLLAEGGTDANHRVTLSRSASPWGPWEPCPWNPILSHSGIQSSIQNTGHADFVEGPGGQWWIVFLGVRPLGHPPTHVTGRETFLAPVEWTDDGWPIVNQGRPITLESSSSAQETHVSTLWRDEFEEENLHHRWVTLGPAYRSVYHLQPSSGLTLHATTSSLSEKAVRAFVGTRLDGHQRRYETTLKTLDRNAEAGIAVLMEFTGFYALKIREASAETSEATLVRHVLDMETFQSKKIPRMPEYRLRLELVRGGSPWSFEFAEFVFSIDLGSNEWKEVGRGTSRLLSSEVIGGFTGLLVGIFCLSDESQRSATFRNFKAADPSP